MTKRARQNYLISKYTGDNMSLATLYTDISKAIRGLRSKSTTDPDPDKREFLHREAERLLKLLGSDVPNGEDPLVYLMGQARDAIADVLDQEYGASVTDPKIFDLVARRFEEEFTADMRALNVLEPDELVRVTQFVKPITEFVQKIVDNGFGYVAGSGSVYFDTNRFANDPKHFYAKLVPTAYGDVDQLATGEGELTSDGEKRSPNDFALWKSSKPGEPAWSSPWGQGRPGWHIECSVMASSVFGESMDIHSGGVDLKFPHHDNELAQSEAYFNNSHWVNYFLHSGHLTISGCKMSKSLKNFITIRDALKEHSARRLRLTFLLHSWRDTMDYSPDTVAEAISYEKTLIDFFYNATNFHLLTAVSDPSEIGAASTNQSLISALIKTQQDVYDALCDSFDTRRAMAVLKDFLSLADQYALRQMGTDLPLPEACDQIHAAACFVLRLLRVFGVADETFASIGTPVPVGATVAGEVISDTLEQNLVSMSNEPSSTDQLHRSWLSMDALTIGRLKLAVDGAIKAAHSFADTLLNEKDTFQQIANETTKMIISEFGLDILKPPDDSSDSLRIMVKTVLNEDLDTIAETRFGLETKVWPVVFRFLLSIVSMRQSVRALLFSNAAHDKTAKQRLLTACDRMRDEDMVLAGIRLQDRAGASDVVQNVNSLPALGLVAPEILTEEISMKTKRELERREAKSRVTASRNEAGRQPPSEMFLQQLNKYSRFDEKGIPTHDASGKEIAKSQLKKLQKLYDAQAKRLFQPVVLSFGNFLNL
ncbi:Cysteinyl tRNA synthetase [Fasciola hepatica]|uniref:cysteine--tRNA ligase n=1 Tax=Fasciola hepatica TaxID=6192 RepID=A0A4E0RY18_FASHE|nr:Cysteinyl tRNA synthetase [Fasciola hepatica]